MCVCFNGCSAVTDLAPPYKCSISSFFLSLFLLLCWASLSFFLSLILPCPLSTPLDVFLTLSTLQSKTRTVGTIFYTSAHESCEFPHLNCMTIIKKKENHAIFLCKCCLPESIFISVGDVRTEAPSLNQLNSVLSSNTERRCLIYQKKRKAGVLIEHEGGKHNFQVKSKEFNIQGNSLRQMDTRLRNRHLKSLNLKFFF